MNSVMDLVPRPKGLAGTPTRAEGRCESELPTLHTAGLGFFWTTFNMYLVHMPKNTGDSTQ